MPSRRPTYLHPHHRIARVGWKRSVLSPNQKRRSDGWRVSKQLCFKVGNARDPFKPWKGLPSVRTVFSLMPLLDKPLQVSGCCLALLALVSGVRNLCTPLDSAKGKRKTAMLLWGPLPVRSTHEWESALSPCAVAKWEIQAYSRLRVKQDPHGASESLPTLFGRSHSRYKRKESIS